VTARYRAPAQDGGLLIEPPPDHVGEQLAANAVRLSSNSVRIAGIPLPEFRQKATTEVIEIARRCIGDAGAAIPAGTRLFVAGHQPEFFHPGVWVKNFALNAFANRHDGIPLNLVVDNDHQHPPIVRVPVQSDSPEHVHAVAVEYDRPGRDLPYEEYRIADHGIFDSFPERLKDKIRDWNFEPFAFAVWPKLKAELDRGATFAEVVSRVRRCIERQWGVTNLELPVSKLAETGAFSQFTQTILGELPRFADCYNASIRAYRACNHIRSLNHPAPELATRDGAIEVPFWAWRSESPRRERVFARDGRPSIGDRAGWKLRPRALTLTLFVRLCLADHFIHGIGGAKYDEVTDDIMRRFFGIEPPTYSVVSATLRLPLPRFEATEFDLYEAERRLRDLEWNPQKFPATRERFPELVAAKARLIAEEPKSTPERRQWFRRLQEVTRQMGAGLENEIEAVEHSVEQIRAELSENAILGSREYAWPLFPREMLQTFFAKAHSATANGPA
jgi:hypothetical protein